MKGIHRHGNNHDGERLEVKKEGILRRSKVLRKLK